MLTEQAKAALERYRTRSERKHYPEYANDLHALADELLRLHPPGWDEEVTPENLEKCGFDCSNRDDVCCDYRIESYEAVAICSMHFKSDDWPQSVYWITGFKSGRYETVSLWNKPSNMLDVWTLMSRLNIPNPLDGDK